VHQLTHTPSRRIDVDVLIALIRRRGGNAWTVPDFATSLRLASTVEYSGSVFIVNAGSHYTTFVLRNGTWWFHDSMLPRPVPVTHRLLIDTLAGMGLSHDTGKKHERRVVFFKMFLP